MKLRIFIILVGAVVTALAIHLFQESQAGRHRDFRRNVGDFRGPGRGAPPPPRRGGPGGGGPPGSGALEIASQFDQDNDGRLDDTERALARKFVKEERGGNRRGPRNSGAENKTSGPMVAQDSVTPVSSDIDLYDEGTLRTLFMEFTVEDWEDELADFWKTDVHVPARLSVDGKSIGEIGVRFRGSSSFFTVAAGQKRSMNLAIDYGDSKQRLQGYKTLNLLNAHTDPSFVRTVLFNHIARHYIPAPKANYVRLVINGESWGIYVNTQQFNKDFLDEWYGSKEGIRWKMLPNPRGGNGLGYEDDSVYSYEGRYQMKSTGGDSDWAALINVFKVLNHTPADELQEALEPLMDLDRALWFLALENTFVDNDGYWVRASDFSMFTDRRGRLHMLPHDSNETFRKPGGPGFSGGVDGVELDPLYGIDDQRKPLIHRLLQVPSLKARYLAHVRTLRDEWLSWDRIEPLVSQYHALIAPVIESDSRKHHSTDTFTRSLTEETETAGFRGPRRGISIKDFVEQRRAYLASYPAFQKPHPVIEAVTHRTNEVPTVTAQAPIVLEAKLGPSPEPTAVYAYVSLKREARYEKHLMETVAPGLYQVTLPGQPAGQKLRYYVEATLASEGSTTFFPRTAAFQPPSFRVAAAAASTTPVMISEIMASNVTVIADPQAQFDDWIELQNTTGEAINIGGYYLSDNENNPRKWRLPENTSVPANGTVLIWADEDGKDPGLHANFKLSKKGETISLYDRDDRNNRRLDTVTYTELADDTAWGRPQGTGASLQRLAPSPGTVNP